MTHQIVDQIDDSVITDQDPSPAVTRAVLANPRFMALFLSQILTQVGGNMVLFGLTIKVSDLTDSATSVSILLLTFLVPAVVFGAVAGVFVDRYDRRKILIATNVARGLLFLPLIWLDSQLVLIYVITAIVATLTTFFAPAESAMIPIVVPRSQLLAANGFLHAAAVVGLADTACGYGCVANLPEGATGFTTIGKPTSSANARTSARLRATALRATGTPAARKTSFMRSLSRNRVAASIHRPSMPRRSRTPAIGSWSCSSAPASRSTLPTPFWIARVATSSARSSSELSTR